MVLIIHFVFSVCLKFLDEMKVLEVKPVVQTYVCLLNACAAAGRLDRVYATFYLFNSALFEQPQLASWPGALIIRYCNG